MATKPLSKEQEIDAGLATAMLVSVLMNDQIVQSLAQMASGAQDPVQPLGQSLADMIFKLKERSEQEGVGLDDNIWLAEGGVVNRVLEELLPALEQAGVAEASTPGFASAVFEEVLEVIKLMSNAGPKAGGGQSAGPLPQEGAMPPPPGGPVAPEFSQQPMGGMV